MKILNLSAGIVGNRKLRGDEHEITAVENVPEIAKIYQDFFPNDKMVIGDAHQYLLDHYEEFDFIWSSPPCPSHSRIRKATHHQNKPIFPDMKLYEEILFLKGLPPVLPILKASAVISPLALILPEAVISVANVETLSKFTFTSALK